MLYSRIYEENIWAQVSEYAYKSGKAFDPSEEIESLSIPNLNYMGRYLCLQIGFLQSHKGVLTESEGAPDISIIPEIYGKPLEKGHSMAKLDKVFEIPPSEEKIQETLKIGHALKVHKIDYRKLEQIVYLNYTPSSSPLIEKALSTKAEEEKGEIILTAEKAEKDSDVSLGSVSIEEREKGGEYYLNGEKEREECVRLQSELRDAVMGYRERGENAKQQVLQFIHQIKNAQLSLLQIRNKLKSNKQVMDAVFNKHEQKHKHQQQQQQQSLQYLVMVCVEYSRILRSVFPRQIKYAALLHHIPQSNLLKFSQTLFRHFIAFESGAPRKEFLALLKDVIVKNMSDRDWMKFSFEIIENFLSLPNSDYSQKAIIEALDHLSIPDAEILSFLVQKLQIPQLKTNMVPLIPHESKQKTAKGQSHFSLVTSVILLTLSSLKKLKVQDGEIIHTGITCFNCATSAKNFISGFRYKCGHCAHLNICSKEDCIKKHTNEHPDHILIAIREPLPYSPNLKDLKNIQVKPLLNPMSMITTTDVHDSDCDNCLNKKIKG